MINRCSLPSFPQINRIRDLNDEINKLIREKGHWEKRIVELGGPNYAATSKVRKFKNFLQTLIFSTRTYTPFSLGTIPKTPLSLRTAPYLALLHYRSRTRRETR